MIDNTGAIEKLAQIRDGLGEVMDLLVREPALPARSVYLREEGDRLAVVSYLGRTTPDEVRAIARALGPGATTVVDAKPTARFLRVGRDLGASRLEFVTSLDDVTKPAVPVTVTPVADGQLDALLTP